MAFAEDLLKQLFLLLNKESRELQDQRHLADYSNATKWDRTKAAAKVNQCKTAFSNWKSIRNEYVAQSSLFLF
jgi:hypothetical protein